MNGSHIDTLRSALQRERERWERCHRERVTFEQGMDINSCEEHRVLRRLYDEEKRSEQDLQSAERQLLEAERRRWFGLDLGRIWDWLTALLKPMRLWRAE